MSNRVLVADIGGTNARVALARKNGSLEEVQSIADETAEGLQDMLADVLRRMGRRRPDVAVLAVAGPVNGDVVKLTNRDWTFSRKALARALRLRRLVVINDFAAVAYALPVLGATDLVSVGGQRTAREGNLLACGPGTGFGVSVLLRNGKARVLATEAGHMRLGAATADEARVVAHLVREKGPASVEDVLSGPGLARLHKIRTGAETSSEKIISAARAGKSEAKATIDAFLRWFGRIAGDLALAFDARGGVFIGGGVGRALAPMVSASPFRAAFDDHPPYEARLAAIPVQVIVHPSPGLLGAAELGRSLLR